MLSDIALVFGVASLQAAFRTPNYFSKLVTKSCLPWYVNAYNTWSMGHYLQTFSLVSSGLERQGCWTTFYTSHMDNVSSYVKSTSINSALNSAHLHVLCMRMASWLDRLLGERSQHQCVAWLAGASVPCLVQRICSEQGLHALKWYFYVALKTKCLYL